MLRIIKYSVVVLGLMCNSIRIWSAPTKPTEVRGKMPPERKASQTSALPTIYEEKQWGILVFQVSDHGQSSGPSSGQSSPTVPPSTTH